MLAIAGTWNDKKSEIEESLAGLHERDILEVLFLLAHFNPGFWRTK